MEILCRLRCVFIVGEAAGEQFGLMDRCRMAVLRRRPFVAFGGAAEAHVKLSITVDCITTGLLMTGGQPISSQFLHPVVTKKFEQPSFRFFEDPGKIF